MPTNVDQNSANGQSPDATYRELIADLAGRLATLNGPAIAAEFTALRQIGEQLLEEIEAMSSVTATGLDLRKIPSAKLRRALITQRGPTSAANFATRLAKDLAAQRGALKIATGGEIKVR